MTTVWVSRHTKQPGTPKLCRASVASRDGGSYSWLHTSQCTRKPVVFRALEAGGETYGFCKQHDPEAVKQRSQARRERWQQEAEAQRKQWDRETQTRIAMDACKTAIEQIAAGHNDPRALAVAALELFPQHHQPVTKET